MNIKQETTTPVLIGRYWLMPDGELVPNIAGGSDGDGAGDTGGSGTGDTGGDGTGDGTGDAGGTGGDNEAALEAARLRKDLKATRTEAANYRRKLRELEDKIDGVDVDKYQTLIEKEAEAEKKRLEEKGQYDKLLEEHIRKSEAQLQQAQETGSKWKQRYEKQVVDNVLISAASDKAINPAEAVTLIRSDYTFNVTDTGDVEIVGSDGKVVFDDSGNHTTPQMTMSEFLASRPHLCKPEGGGTGSTGGGKANKQQTANQSSGDLTGAQRIAAALKQMKNA